MKKYLLLLLLLQPAMSFSEGLLLHSSVLSDRGATPRTEAQFNATVTMSTVLKDIGVDPYSAIASTNMGEGVIWYRLFDDMTVFSVDVNTHQHIGNWDLGTYTEEVSMSGEGSSLKVSQALSRIRTGNDEYIASDPLNQEKVIDPFIFLNPDLNEALGCMQKMPLRYGDIESDGGSELVLFLTNHFLIFSPLLGRVIFSSELKTQDMMTVEEVSNWGFEQDEDSPQWLAAGGTDPLLSDLFPAMRSYAKLYFSDFNEDELHDIVVWRKLYESRLVSDPIEGFELKGDLFVHYSLIEGEYKLQETEQAEIQGWLTAGELSWQKGYPSKSECDGEEGQLISEMHDPLLNDPDVLH